MLADQRSKLMAEDPMDANDLRDILYTIFADDAPVDVGQGVKATVPTGSTVPPIQITNAGTGTIPVMSVQRRNGDTATISLSFDGTLSSTQEGQTHTPTVGVGVGATVYPGKLIAHGAGNVYTVSIYPNGTTGTFRNVQVNQLGGDPTIPHTVDGTVWTEVFKIGNLYFMAIPYYQ